MDAYAVDLQDVSVVRGGRSLLAGVSLHVPAGTCCAILGPNGSGKSTLVSVLSGYTWPSRGLVDIGGHIFGKVDLARVRQGIGVIEPSRSPAFDAQMPVREVVATGLFGTIRLPLRGSVRPAQWRRVDAEIDGLGLGKMADSVFSQLSTGEQMKALLARAMVAQTGLLLLDEPTAGLDLGARAACVAALERLLNRRRHPTVVIVSHHLDELPCAVDQVVLLKQGTVFASGRAEQVLSSDRLSRLFGCRVEVLRSDGRYVASVRVENG
ncbi:MAG TPA: ATP-binding cassette domain-containing protein [Sedimentisphaerales bacterium]|jgi:iron complex transport system ATP-binding protein|nr:ATP-binding cassette domain-containing protein [Sedimentisphaerales bacterium]HNU31653.1 ATP-binding cassette domain-containing protein [Sedimentisphaerales bacterium]